MTAGWPGRQYHTGVVKPSSLPLFSPNYSHSLSITPHNSGKLSNGRNNSNFNLSVPVVSTKKMLSRALRLLLPRFGGQWRGGGARPPARGCSAQTGGKEASGDGTRTLLQVMGGDGRGACWMLGASPPGTTRAPRWQPGWHWGDSSWGAAPCPLHGGTWCPWWGGPGLGKALSLPTLYPLFSAKAHRPGHQFLVKKCFPSWELALRKGNSELPRNALAF